MYYLAVPVLLVALFTYVLAGTLFSVYEMCIDTIFICFVEDGERNDGSLERPYFMSDNLLKFMDDAAKTTKSVQAESRTTKVVAVK